MVIIINCTIFVSSSGMFLFRQILINASVAGLVFMLCYSFIHLLLPPFSALNCVLCVHSNYGNLIKGNSHFLPINWVRMPCHIRTEPSAFTTNYNWLYYISQWLNAALFARQIFPSHSWWLTWKVLFIV